MVLSISMVTLLIMSLLGNGFKIDEVGSHFPAAIMNLEKGVFFFLEKEYPSANTPLPYIICNIPVIPIRFVFPNLVPGIWYYRAVNMIIAFFCMLLLWDWLKKENSKYHVMASFILFLYPYFLKPAFSFYMSVYGLLFFLLFIYLYSDENIWRNFLSGLMASFAILSQQTYLVVLAYPLLKLLQNLPSYDSGKIKAIIVFFLPAILPLSVFYLWGGFTHYNFRHHSVQFVPENVTSIIVICGLLFFPYFLTLINNKKLQRIPAIIILFITAIWLYHFDPKVANFGGIGTISGYTFKLINITAHIFPLFPFFIKLLLGSSFAYILYYSFFEERRNPMYYLMMLFMILFCFSVILSERHLLPVAVIGYALFLPKIRTIFPIALWLFFQALAGIGYFIYYIFFATGYSI